MNTIKNGVEVQGTGNTMDFEREMNYEEMVSVSKHELIYMLHTTILVKEWMENVQFEDCYYMLTDDEIGYYMGDELEGSDEENERVDNYYNVLKNIIERILDVIN